ncbi:MAG: homoserine kinase [Elusimicrobia bacterium]|nr:homoserine kinase [Elusimicrobiota bacterium]
MKVPATSANLGAGFDVLGLALNHYNEVEMSAWDSDLLPPLSLQVEGEGADQLPLNKSNLVYRAACRVMDKAGLKIKALRIRMVNRIPLSRGMGSSAAAIVGGAVALNAGLGEPLSFNDLLSLAVEEEGHSDNVAPALAGGLCVSTVAMGKVECVSWGDKKLFRGIRAVICVPSFELSTNVSREALPATLSRQDAVFNCSRVALFLSALQHRRYELLSKAMEDRLHQPYRKRLVPGFDDVVLAARDAGAWGVALSGAGPSVLALSPEKSARRIGEAMCEAFRKHDISSLWLDLDMSPRGAYVTHLKPMNMKRNGS